jgi:hypothetical protein
VNLSLFLNQHTRDFANEFFAKSKPYAGVDQVADHLFTFRSILNRLDQLQTEVLRQRYLKDNFNRFRLLLLLWLLLLLLLLNWRLFSLRIGDILTFLDA